MMINETKFVNGKMFKGKRKDLKEVIPVEFQFQKNI